MGERMKFTIRMNSISLLVVLLTVAAGSAEEQVARKPKLFFVSTGATTSTLQTLSVCYYTTTSVAACGGRKRRAIDVDGDMSLKTLTELESSHSEEDTSIEGSRKGGSCFTGSPPLPSPPPPRSPPHTPSAVLSALLPDPISVDRQKTTKVVSLFFNFFMFCKEYTRYSPEWAK